MKAINRRGEEFEPGQFARLVDFPELFAGTGGRKAFIKDVKACETECESGFNILAVDCETQKEFKKWIDTNWFTHK